MKNRRGSWHRSFQLLLSLLILGFSLDLNAQFLWQFAGNSYPTRGEAEAALRAHPSPQYLQFAEPWYEKILWRDPATAVYWYTVFDYQAATDVEFYGYTVDKECGFYDGTDCNSTIEEAVNSSYPNPSAMLCDVKFEVLDEFDFRGQQWQEVLEHGIRFWASESAPMRVDFHYNNVYTGNCEYGSSVNQTIHRVSLASCTHDLSPISGSYIHWKNPPEFPNVCSPSGREPPMSNIAAISKRLTSVCTATEGNPCSPMTGNKSLTETDFRAGPFEITRHYNSSLELGSRSIGAGWSHNYDTRLISSGGYTLVKPDGNVEEFSSASNGGYRSVTNPGKILMIAGDLAQLTYPGGRKEIYQLTASSDHGQEQFRLIEIYTADLPDRAITLTYSDSAGLLDSITGPSGRQLLLEYDLNGSLSTLLLPDGKRILYSRDASGNLSEVTFQDGSKRTYLYEDSRLPHHLTGIIDENGARFATYQYDAFGRVTLSEHAAGANRVTLNYLEAAITEVTGPLGEIRSYQFDPYKPSFDVSDVSDGDGMTAYTRDANGWPTQSTNAAGHTVESNYDEFHEISRVEGAGTPEQRTVITTWNNDLNRKILIEEAGVNTRFDYDGMGRLVSKSMEDLSSGSVRTWSYRYYPDTDPDSRAGRLRSIDGPRADVADISTFSYYSSNDSQGHYRKGDLHSTVNAAGHVTEYLEYDGNGRLIKLRDANDVITLFSYHARGWLGSRAVDGASSVFHYDRTGNLVGTTSSDGAMTAYRYDEAHRLVEITDSLGNRIEYVLDAQGNRIEENTFDDGGNLRKYKSRTFNPLNQLEKLTDSNGDFIRYTYDSLGLLSSTQDENLKITRHEYDVMNRLIRSIDPLLGETRVTYDKRGNPVGVTDPLGNVTRYQYDGLNNLLSRSSPDTGIMQSDFDNAGNRIATTDARGVRVTYLYDELNRLTAINYPDSSKDVSFNYDDGPNGKGRLTGMGDEAGLVSYQYDARGNLLSESRSINGRQYLTKYDYDAGDRLVRLEYPSGKAISYILDDTGRISSIYNESRALLSNAQFEPFGPVNSFTYGNGLNYSAVFSPDQEMTRLESGADLSLDLEYGPAGSILRINDQMFTYDPLYRLDAFSSANGTERFEYDANDNRVQHQGLLSNSSYTYDIKSNHLKTTGEWSVSHDAAGNRTAKLDQAGNGQLYRFGDHNRLTEAIDRYAGAGVTAGHYRYDGRGRRIAKTVSESETHYIYNLSGQLIGEYSTDGTGEYREYVYLEGLPIAVLTRSAETVLPPGAELILDNGDPGTSAGGNWRSKTGKQHFGPDYLFAGKSEETSYRWTARPPGDRYRVYAWWVDRKNQSGNVRYNIRHGAGQLDTVTRSQKTGGGQWQLLGTYFSQDGQDYVEVSSDTSKFTADAIRWVALLEPVVTLTDNTHYIHFDHLGTPARVTDEEQSVVWTWDSAPFGDTRPDEDPDGDSSRFVLNFRFPGQYFDAESGLHYNYFRNYDPETGRYLESDPIGLAGGMNPYSYVGGNPLSGIDPFGLATVGSWIDPPRFNLTEVGVYDWELIAPKFSWWGYADFIKLHGRAAGFVNIDVGCSNECNDWEIHDTIELEAHGDVTVGPNLYAILIGLRFGPIAGVAGNVAIGGASLLEAEHQFLSLANEKAGPIISAALKYGPTGVCLGLLPGL